MPDKKAARFYTFARGLLCISEPDRPPPTFPSATPVTKEEKEGWAMYTKELEYVGRGDPLWQPCEGINVGDVGYIHHGQFEMLFPVHSLFGGQSLGVKIPDGFKKSIFQGLATSWDQPGCFHSKCVKPIGPCDETQRFTHLPEDKTDAFIFELSGLRGAALVTRYPILRTDLPVALEDLFDQYLEYNYDLWVKFARDKGSREIKPILVSGFDLVRDFVMVSYPKSGPFVKSPVPITEAMFNSSPPHCQGQWYFQSVPHSQEQVSTEFDQCVFIRPHTLRRRGDIPKSIRAAAGPHDLGSGDNKRGDFPGLPVQSNTEPIVGGDSRGQLGLIARGASSKPGDADWATQHDKEFDKWDIIADYIFQKSDAVTALMHHRDVARILMVGRASIVGSKYSFCIRQEIEKIYLHC